MQARSTVGAGLQRRAPARGFTLIEVLAALVIVALGMIAAIQAVTQSARNGTYLREKTLAHWIGMNVITDRRLQGEPPDVAESTGRVEFAGEFWQWTMKVTQTQVDSLRRMDVAVRRADAPEDSVLASVSGFYGKAIGRGTGVQWNGTGAPGGSGDEGADEGSNQGANDGTDNSGSKPGKMPTRPPRPPSDDEQ
jgi:general secretion pathway protein I